MLIRKAQFEQPSCKSSRLKTRQLEKELEQMKAKLAAAKGADLISNAVEVGGVKVLAAQLDGVEPKALA